MKKFYTLLTALAATVAMNAAETYTVQCYPVDYSGSTPVTTETPVSQTIVVDGRNVTFPDILGAEGVSPTFSIPDDPANGTYTCDISNWKSGSYNLGTIGTGTKCYFEKTCNNYTTVKYYPSTNTFEFYAYFYGIIEGDYETYGFICVMPDGFLAEASQENNATGYVEDSNYQWGGEFTFTQTYTINGGVVTLTNFLGSSQNVEITAYDNGKAKQTGGLEGYISDTYTFWRSRS